MKMKGIIAAVAVAVCCAADAATAPNSTASAATSLQSGTFGAGVAYEDEHLRLSARAS